MTPTLQEIALRPLVIATRNRHKALEIQAVLGEGFDYRTLAGYAGVPEVQEDADSFAGNAAKKASALACWLVLKEAGRPRAAARPTQSRSPDSTGPRAASSPRELLVLADDSGLEVDALGGAPGVFSARFAAMDRGSAGNSTDEQNNRKLLGLLEGLESEARTARFRCVIAVARVWLPDVRAPARVGGWRVRLFEGVCEGRLLAAPRGANGFGYDPLFQPLGHTATFAELGEAVKNRISHRARALASLQEWLTARPLRLDSID